MATGTNRRGRSNVWEGREVMCGKRKEGEYEDERDRGRVRK
jgi:hypothetical protein